MSIPSDFRPEVAPLTAFEWLLLYTIWPLVVARAWARAISEFASVYWTLFGLLGLASKAARSSARAAFYKTLDEGMY